MQLLVPSKYTTLRLYRDVPCKLVAHSTLRGIMIVNHNECDVEVCTPTEEHCIIKPDTIKKYVDDAYVYGVYTFTITDATPQASLTIIGIDRLEEMYRI
jgi:hypothetical protein